MYYTAPSFQNFEKVSEAYVKNGKMYVDVKHPNTGNIRSVRLYTEKEYKKAYPNVKVSAELDKKIKSDDLEGLKKARGFSAGPITLVSTSDEKFLSKSNARYATDIGWYIVSTEKVPTEVPTDWKEKVYTWEMFCKRKGIEL